MAIPSNATFLIAEDDEPTRKELIVNLRELGFNGKILEAENGTDAYTIFIDEIKSGNKIDFIISDMVMPVSNGYEFLVSVRKDEEYQNIPFLILTSKNDRELVVQCAKAKVSNYLIKPWNVQTLGEKLHSCWDKHFPG